MTNPWKQQGRRRPYAVYSAEVADTICARLVEGESLRAICSDAGMPARATVFRWIARHKEFRDWYISARDFQAEGLGEEMIEIVRDTSGDDLAFSKRWRLAQLI
jgi:Bacteriophage Sf6, terminase small subunit-like